MGYEDYFVHQIKEYIRRRVLKSKRAIHEDTLFKEVYRGMRHLKQWFDIDDLFNRATRDLLREEVEIGLDSKGYWRKVRNWNSDYPCERVEFPFGVPGFRCVDRESLLESATGNVRIRVEPFSRDAWNLFPGEKSTALGLFSVPLEFVGYEDGRYFVDLYFYGGEKNGRHFFLEIPIFFNIRKVRIGDEVLESPFQFLWLSRSGSIDIPYIPGKGWKVGGKKVEKPFVKDGVLL